MSYPPVGATMAAMSKLASKRCLPCEGATDALSGDQIQALLPEVPAWSLEGPGIVRRYALPDFASALALLNRIGAVAEEEGHHPDLRLHAWRHLEVVLFTHKVQGLTEADFVLAAKIDLLKA